ncbi:DNA polymerase type-X / 3'-5' exodeoxyribonuclease [Candidatus Kuenenia stuttgartiensis]|uniref:DNA polymerase beta n=1 Tax=Kuenenia stuttgartiensis TaxID=174633 RepID=Q1Q353_KUEST|nr:MULTISPECIES: DNA polymerase/3'-5' exonuclease PolX [Kuenenia]MBE7548968.1 DNA polymerase/3'-5' exonuclease PolX [Planctomycetia bacterium]MBZ0192267.1 DNA polymerase/3'-5' exonuclease PolX [Candidatus Kuenenia stuttgartiensis]MCF6153562.1 DNA polymerase/3'-5' exonuclease PolX [Candidatus Kuenenia stuttgartiensis]MCL4728219.1 DNA polymerase/3'-5' exonuclease PolX [Candidatus Kuenenia stuttgartiensis]MCZ7622088.1 DNA polymerase/3'-5' exonuclease PolX [Candidatus Kuenenia sp.]
MKNHEVALLFGKIADVLELKGENTFRINSYRKAARVIEDLTEDIEALARDDKLTNIPGIGKGTADKIIEYITTGKMSKYEEVAKGISEETVALMQIPGLGPKTVAMLNKELGIVNLVDIENAIRDGKLKGLFGIGEKKIENIVKGIELYKTSQQRISIGMAYPIVKRIIERLKQNPKVKEIQAAGSLRRMKETVGDIDILATGNDGAEIIKSFVTMPEVTQILASGTTKGSVRLEEGVQADLRVVNEEEYGAALQYFTGSKDHNVHLRELAKKKGYKISEYGIFEGEKKLGGRHESDIYKILGMDWIPPELRENRGEIEAAIEKTLPKLIEYSDIKGDLHNHSNWSDGHCTFEEMAEHAMKRGYAYMVVSDHSQSLHIANGLTEERLLKEIDEIDKLNKNLKGFTLLKASEVDIRTDGSLDFSDRMLEKLDVVIAAIHSGFKQEKEKITQRMIAAIQNPFVNIIAHPTGRLISKRVGYDVDIEKVLDACAETDTALEINCYYDRLDLNDIYCKKAKERGVKIAISTDSHHTDQMWMMELGVGIARRGWLESQDVINTFSLEKLKSFCKKKRKHGKRTM